MKGSEFHPKAFYRKLDSLLVRIGSSANTKDVLSLVLHELVNSFGSDLMIKGGCVYELKGGRFRLIKDAVGGSMETWPDSIRKDDTAVSLLMQHKSYIFDDASLSPWGNDSMAVIFGVDDNHLMVFRLESGWERESLEFSLNTIRSTLNYSSTTSKFRSDLREARDIQVSLLPRRNPTFAGYDIAGLSMSAEYVGGDLFDFHFLDEESLGIAIGDASGHGLPAALVARDVVTGLRMGVESKMKISGVISKLNRVINRSRLSTRFVSLLYGELEKSGTLVYINAGHPPPILVKESTVERLDVGGTILGPLTDPVFKRGFAYIDPGDILVMFTDGIAERADHDGCMYGEERIISLVRKLKDKSAEMIVKRLYSSILEFGGGEKLRDDATAVIVKRNV